MIFIGFGLGILASWIAFWAVVIWTFNKGWWGL